MDPVYLFNSHSGSILNDLLVHSTLKEKQMFAFVIFNENIRIFSSSDTTLIFSVEFT